MGLSVRLFTSTYFMVPSGCVIGDIDFEYEGPEILKDILGEIPYIKE